MTRRYLTVTKLLSNIWKTLDSETLLNNISRRSHGHEISITKIYLPSDEYAMRVIGSRSGSLVQQQQQQQQQRNEAGGLHGVSLLKLRVMICNVLDA